MKISELAKKTNIEIDTIRYYEKVGLIPKPQRSEKGYRHYDDRYVNYLEFIRKAKEMTFTLEEISKFIPLRCDNGKICGEVSALINRKIGLIDNKISELKKIKELLAVYVHQCESPTESKDCGFLGELAFCEEKEIIQGESHRVVKAGIQLIK